MTTAVLDASALLALLLGEPGAERVKAVLADSAMSAVNVAEVVAYFARSSASEDDIRRMLEGLTIEHVPLDRDLAYAVGMLYPAVQPAGLSIGDRACLALARRLGVPAVTADRAWLRVASAVGVSVDLIR